MTAICKTCVLPDTFPGVDLDKNGQCIHCRRFGAKENLNELKARYEQKFLDTMESNRYGGPYDSLVAYSGGKDSTYTLKLLKERYGLRLLAITFDHGFVSPTALDNIRTVVDRLDVDHLTVHPGAGTLGNIFVGSMAKDVYPIKSLERASAICNSCMNLIKSFLLKTALEMKVPFIVYGWSPGQAPIQSSVFKTNGSMIHQMQKTARETLEKLAGRQLPAFFLDKERLKRLNDRGDDQARFPWLINPLAFLKYDEADVLDDIRQLGWITPQDTDANSTNCLLNGLANQVHMAQHGFHPYAAEIAGLVRAGYMSRAEGLKKLAVPPDPAVIHYVKQKLGIDENA